MRSTFEIATDFYVLNDLANTLEVDENGEIINNDEVLKQLFNDIKGELGDKLDNTQRVIKSLKASETALDDEIKRLQARKKAFKNKQDSLKDIMLSAIKATGQTKLKTDLHNFSIRKSQSVNIIDDELIGREFKKMVLNVDKTLIKTALKDGKTVEGADMQENYSLNVR